ncbi:MAG: hypothetical protein U0163_17090 [Gemmatimonadaceae bacterium]
MTCLFKFEVVQHLLAAPNDGAIDLPYEDTYASGAVPGTLYRRIVEEMRTRYRSDDLTHLLTKWDSGVACLARRVEAAFTQGLLDQVFRRTTPGQPTESLLPNPALVLPADATHTADRGGYADLDGDHRWVDPLGPRVLPHGCEGHVA